MQLHRDFAEAVGNTPMILLRGPSEETGCEIWAKAEFMNPGGSVKDRAALAIIRAAEAAGQLRPGGVVVEGTAGNTGIGLALAANSMGYQCVIVMPETQTVEKQDTIRSCGARLRLVPAVPYKDPQNYVRYSGRLAEELAQSSEHGAVWANQFDNVANRQAHYDTTGPEILEQMQGRVDGFASAVGTGGTLAGVSAFLRERLDKVQVALADPPGAALHSFYTQGELRAEGSSVTEGIGQGRITANLEGFAPDHSFLVDDGEALTWMFRLCREEGLFLGGSSGVNVAGAVRLAREMGPGHRLVTLLCDSGSRYQSKLYNPVFLREKGLPVPQWLEVTG